MVIKSYYYRALDFSSKKLWLFKETIIKTNIEELADNNNNQVYRISCLMILDPYIATKACLL